MSELWVLKTKGLGWFPGAIIARVSSKAAFAWSWNCFIQPGGSMLAYVLRVYVCVGRILRVQVPLAPPPPWSAYTYLNEA